MLREFPVSPPAHSPKRGLPLVAAAGEGANRGPPIPVIQEFLARELVRLESVAPARSEPADGTVLDRLLFEVVAGTTSVVV